MTDLFPPSQSYASNFFLLAYFTMPYNGSDGEDIIILMGSRTCYHKIWHLGTLKILSWRSLRRRQKKQESHTNFTLLSFFPETGLKTPKWNVPSLYQEEGRNSYHQNQGIWGQEIYINKPLIKLTPVLLVTSSPLTTPSSNPFVLSILHKFLVSLSKGTKASCFGHFLGFSLSCEGCHVHVKIR